MISLMLCFGLSALSDTGNLQAQNDRKISPLNEADFICWQQLDCVVESEDLREKGWVLTFDESIRDYPQPRTAQMDGENLSVTAHYDIDGNLISGNYKLKNVALPRTLLAHIATENAGWAMTGNEITVQDFNAATTTYRVFMESESGKRTVTFSQSDILDMKARNAESFAENQK